MKIYKVCAITEQWQCFLMYVNKMMDYVWTNKLACKQTNHRLYLWLCCDLQKYLIWTTHESKCQVLSLYLIFSFLLFSNLHCSQQRSALTYITLHNLRPWSYHCILGLPSLKETFFFSLSYRKAIKIGNAWEKGDTLWLYKRTKVPSSFYV